MMGMCAPKHLLHLSVYGDDNQKRFKKSEDDNEWLIFSYGVANPAASIRIPASTAKSNGKGVIEDRRPASNIDPYVVAALITDSSIL